MPQITVIVPVYKVEAYLHRCIDSILGQTFENFELVLVDDGSPDNSGAICDEYAAKDRRIVVIHQQNGGLSAARNAGIEWVFANSDSRWLTFIDSDDWVHPRYLELLLRAAQEHSVDISMGLLIHTDIVCEDFPELKGEINLCSPETIYAQDYNSSVVACGKLLRREIFRDIRFPVGKLYEDLQTTYRYFFSQDAIALVSDGLYYYYQGSVGIMRSQWRIQKLDIIDAQETALRFFETNHYEKARKRQLESYITHLRNQCWEIEALPDDSELKHHIRHLRSRLRSVLFRYRKYQKLPLMENAAIYNQAFPSTMRVYWAAYAVRQKIRTEGILVALRKLLHRLTKH